jgi:hypothetical protein
MNYFYGKILVVPLIFLGESLSIYAEMLMARNAASNPIVQLFLKMFAVIALAGGILVIGYALGYASFQNIWIVSVTSITSILIMEPLLGYLFFRTLPTEGALIGLLLGVLGFIAAIFF